MSPLVCFPDEDLIVLGDGACLGAYAYLLGHEMTRNGKFKRGPVVVGAGSIAGPAARLSPFVTTGADSNVPALESALPGQKFLPVAAAVAVAMLPPSGMPPATALATRGRSPAQAQLRDRLRQELLRSPNESC